MNRHKKTFFYFFLFLFISFFFISFVNAVVHENDIDFDFIQTTIYDENNPAVFNITYGLNATTYNNTDYFEHSYAYNSSYFDNLYVNQTYFLPDYFDTYGLLGMVYLNNSFYCVSQDFSQNITIVNRNFDVINTFENNLQDLFWLVRGIATDGVYIYITGMDTEYYPYPWRVVRIDMNWNLVDILFESSTIGFTDLIYYNNHLYCIYGNSESLQKRTMNFQLVETYSLKQLTPGYRYMITYYQGSIYFHNQTNDYVYRYNLNVDGFNYLNTINEYSYFDDNGITIDCYYAYNGLLYYNSLLSNVVNVLTIEFEENTNHSIIYDYPDNEGLLDDINNLNINLTHTTNPIGHYNATFSFIDDYIGQIPNDWNNYSTVNSNAYVIDYLDNHKKIIELIDNSASSYYGLYHSFGNNESGSIEYWYRTNDTMELQYMLVSETSSTLVQFYIYNGEFAYEDGVGTHSIVSALNNVWYHIRIDFECGSGLYSGLSADTFKVFINGTEYGNYDFINNGNYVNRINFRSSAPANNFESHFDAIGFNWLVNYDIGINLEYGLENNGFYNEWNFTSKINEVILSIECLNGTYYINDVSTDFNVFFNYSEYIYDTWILNIELSQITENGTFSIYNESNVLLYNESFDTIISSNIKYIKYYQHYQNSEHFFNISNVYLYSNETMIIGQNGFLIYEFEDLDVWNFQVNTLLNITAYGRYRFYVCNQNQSIIYRISNWIEMRNEEVSIYVDNYNVSFNNPFLLVETLNGLYSLFNIKICTSLIYWILSDERGFTYSGTISNSNVDITNSYFYIDDTNLLRFNLVFDDNNTEYMLLTFDITNVVNLNYQCLYSTFFNNSDDSIIREMRIKYTDYSFTKIDIEYGHNNGIEVLEQEKTTSIIEFYISDNDLQNNLSVSGYIDGFTFNYSEEVSISVFITNIVEMLIPLMIILSLSFGLSVVLKDKNDKDDFLNQKAFFPIFFIVCIIVFVLGYFEAWILFVILISGIAYIIEKRDDYT